MSTQPPAAVPDQGGLTVLRILLGTQLRRLREANGVTREAAGEAIRASSAKISRLELGRVGCKERDVLDLLTLYGVTDPAEREGYRDLATRANARGWWQQHNDVLPSWFEMYLRLEQAAKVIRTFELQFVPGLLQTEEYARSVILLGHRGSPPDDVDQRVQLRMSRQKMLGEPGAPQVWAVLDEAAVSRPYGTPAVMRAQLEHLLEAGHRPNVTIQLLPFRAGSHAAAGGPFSILRFAEPDLPDVVYLEQLNSAVYLDKRSDVEDYAGVWERLVVQALTPRDTRAALTELIGRLP
ncbi:helix-turn-helix domain-containing protein [Pseudonocardia hydrocarbonoxydans]|uniref:Transcriptional regulator n=1 Tax=Pseudonocardia hydrocarbonoxydans TaxID=76726 RepID=A0A4Y3WJ65_9PSEU|nr:helix-turn-helix transcriptional regulator [Pseudonocardia hydrocarbonoxydans]GEC18883.1 transcriptional regulator [Pseudonocardia hydrocarbonoxydans]